jgi:hypothetical protein
MEEETAESGGLVSDTNAARERRVQACGTGAAGRTPIAISGVGMCTDVVTANGC